MDSKNQSHSFTFDEAAQTYDSDFTHSAIGKFQRQRVYQYLSKYVSGQEKNILEINCGTGEDALWLAENGNTVVATDISTGMIETAQRKLNNSNSKLPIRFYCHAFTELVNHFDPGSFDLIFSNFGGLNCVDQLTFKKLSDDFSHLLKPGGTLIAVIMGRKCLWEILYFMLKCKPAQAFRRLSKNGIPAKVGNRFQETYYFSPAELKKITTPGFQFIDVKPVGIALPPSYLEPFFKNKNRLLSFLNRIEKTTALSFLSDYADHYFIVFKKPNKLTNVLPTESF